MGSENIGDFEPRIELEPQREKLLVGWVAECNWCGALSNAMVDRSDVVAQAWQHEKDYDGHRVQVYEVHVVK